jgi:L-ascorbate metabolism protein UlaG (beta-lactamase superfamily)
MQIQKFEQSGFIITGDNGYKLAIDIGNKTEVEKLEGFNVDAMIVSHIHGDHFHLENIFELNPKKLYLNTECVDAVGESDLTSEVIKIKTGDVLEFDNFKINIFTVDHGPNVSVPVENLGFEIEVDNQKTYFCGDLYNADNLDVSGVQVDYLLLPVGGHYTFGPTEALEFAKQFKKVGTVIPMHYEKNNFIESVRCDEFIEIAKGIFNVKKC